MHPGWITYADPGCDLQTPFEAAVIMPTLLRPCIAGALRSIFAQNFSGRIQVLIGVDVGDDLAPVTAACRERPSHCVVQVVSPGYSTSARHGGGATVVNDGGTLRAALSLLANSRYLAYLDDDNWWHRDHLALLRLGVAEGDWAYTLRWFVHPETKRPICIDRWESVGPHRGVFAERFGGFVDPNCLMIDRAACQTTLVQWALPYPVPGGEGLADRMVFNHLRDNFRGVLVQHATSYYVLNVDDPLHPMRLALIGEAYAAAER